VLALLLVAAIYGIGFALGLRIAGSAGLLFLVLGVMALGYVGVGMVLGALCTSKQVGYTYTAVLLPTIFSGTWFELRHVGQGFRNAVNVLPFAHALDAARAVTMRGAGFTDIAGDFLWVLGFSVLFVTLGILAFMRRMTE